MSSIRRRVRELDGDLSGITVDELHALMMDIGTIKIHGYEEVTITIKGRREELEDLAQELQTWTPGGGWSKEALALFLALHGEE